MNDMAVNILNKFIDLKFKKQFHINVDEMSIKSD